jgi:hypothetical protein
LNLPPPYRVNWFADQASAETANDPTHYSVPLTDGSRLSLPLTPLPGGDKAVALLMSNQTDFAVERKIVERMIEPARAAAPEAVVGIPTLGLTYARPVAQALGLPDFVALGHSRKFWYDDALSEAVVSSTSPDHSKRVYLDPALLERVRERRVVVVDDVLNTGARAPVCDSRPPVRATLCWCCMPRACSTCVCSRFLPLCPPLPRRCASERL